MAHTLGTSATITAGTTNPKTLAYTCPAGATVLVLAFAVAGAVDRAGGTPTYNGITLTHGDMTRKYATSPEASAELWFLYAPPTGASYNISIPNTGGKSIWGAVITFKAQAGYETITDDDNGGTGNTANPSLSITPTVAGDAMVEVLAHGNSSVPTGRTHTSLVTQDWGQYVAAIQYGLIAGTGAVAMGFTIAADDWGMRMTAFKERELVIPNAPTAAHTDSKTSVQIVMHWTDNSDNETGFKIYKDDAYLETIAAGSVSYTFINLSPGVTYDLAVKATNTVGDSAEAQLTETTLAPPTAPSDAHTNSKTATTVVMHWTDNSSDETGFKCYQDGVLKQTVGAGVVTYTFVNLSPSTQYTFTVKATNAGGDSSAATDVETTNALPVAPTAAHTDSKTNVQIVMGWTDNATDETGYKMYKNDVYVTTIAAGSTQYTFAGLTGNTQYDLAVKATNANGDSAEAQLTETTRLLATAVIQLNIEDWFYNVNTLIAAALKINIGDVWKDVVGMSINIGDVWKDVWPVSGVSYYGVITALSTARYIGVAASVGSYALFGGGYSIAAGVDAYNESLTRSTPTALSVGRSQFAATSVGSYALFGGGSGSGIGVVTVVDAYNASLTRSTPTALSAPRYMLAAATVGNYALFGGGGDDTDPYDSDVVDAYNTSLVRSTPTALSDARYFLSAGGNSNYALFGGGTVDAYASNLVDAYNTSLVRSTPTVLSQARVRMASAAIGDYILFGGGSPSSGNSATVDAYDASLARSTPTVLSTARRDLAAAANSISALFGGGWGPSDYSAVVDAYNASLVRSIPTALSATRAQLSAAAVGDYILFGGGETGWNRDVVDAYIAGRLA